MSLTTDLRIYLWSLRQVGILCASYVQPRNEIVTTNYDHVMALCVLCLIQITLGSVLIYSVIYADSFMLDIYNKTGNIYLIINTWFCCLIVCILSIYFWAVRTEHNRIVQVILHLNRDFLDNGLSTKLNRLYGLYVAMVFLSIFTYAKAFYNAKYLSLFVYICYVYVYPVNFMYVGLVVMFFRCITSIVAGSLRCYNEQLEQLIASLVKTKGRRNSRVVALRIYEILSKRNRLVAFCYRDINKIYGIALLFISAYILFSAPSGPFFLISVVFELKQERFVNLFHATYTTLLWGVPWITVFIMMLSSNAVSREVHKTAKILFKLPRNGTGIDKMVDKFLLKNFPRLPILTAYGFFALDRVTLFKSFTVIFTYMAILVQFKEMERKIKFTDVI